MQQADNCTVEEQSCFSKCLVWYTPPMLGELPSESSPRGCNPLSTVNSTQCCEFHPYLHVTHCAWPGDMGYL